MIGCKKGASTWRLGDPVIKVSNCLLHDGKTYYKHLDEVRSRFRPQKIKVTHEDRFEDCEDAIRKAKIDVDKGALRIVRFNGFQGAIADNDYLLQELLGVDVNNTGCTKHSWSDCYNEQMVEQIRLKYGEEVFDLLKEYGQLQGEEILLDLEARELVKGVQLPTLGEGEESFRNDVRKIACNENIVYMSFVIEVLKNGKLGTIAQTGGNPELECGGKLSKLIKNHQGWQAATSNGKPIDSIISFVLIF